MAKSHTANTYYYGRHDRKPVMAHFDEEGHEKIRQAAFEQRVSMTKFVSTAALAAAEKLLKKRENSG